MSSFWRRDAKGPRCRVPASSAGFSERPLANTPRHCFGTRLQALTWFPDFSGQVLQIAGGLIESVLTLELGSKRDLQELRGRKATPLQLFVKLVGQVDLKPRHTPNYTPIPVDAQ